ncbi:MAG: hypothetical protein M3297_10390 [Thermoproteota archaeon]|nr:hypothetical protein [Thermoproteota archaeon]
MKSSILSIILMTLIISLTITVGSDNLTTSALAIEDYLQLRSANVNYHGGELDVDIRTGGNVPSENGNNGFGYAILTDVGDESVDNVLVAISDIGIKNLDKSTKHDKLNTYVLDLTGDTTRACSDSDYEVTKSSSDNEAFDTDYPIDVEGNKISIDDIDTNDLASDTVKAIASFTAEAITNNGKIKQICIDIQDVLKQSEIGVSYNNNNNDDNNDDHDNDDDKSRHKDDNKKDNDDDKNRKDHDDDSKKDDNGDDSLFETDIDQSIEQSNECNNDASCSNEANNDVDVDIGEESSSDDDDSYVDGIDLDIDQLIGQSNTCDDEADCDNEGSNEANLWEDISDNSDIGISQSIEQSNTCSGEANCSNEANNEANVFGYSSAADDDEDFDFDSDVDISQSIEQSNTCSGSSTCSSIASNVANIS